MSEKPANVATATERAAYVEPHVDEGHSVAGWVGVTVMLIGVAIATLALFIDAQVLLWVGVGLLAVGIILWPVLKLVGFGPKDH